MESKVTIDDKAVRKMIQDHYNRTMNLKPVMRVISQDMQTQKDMNFKKETDPDNKPWAKLSIDSTLKGALSGLDTVRKGDKVLQDTGRLKASFTTRSTTKSAQIGTNLKYAKTHQYGARQGQYRSSPPIPWGNIPQRRMVGINNKSMRRYNRWVLNYILQGKLG